MHILSSPLNGSLRADMTWLHTIYFVCLRCLVQYLTYRNSSISFCSLKEEMLCFQITHFSPKSIQCIISFIHLLIHSFIQLVFMEFPKLARHCSRSCGYSNELDPQLQTFPLKCRQQIFQALPYYSYYSSSTMPFLKILFIFVQQQPQQHINDYYLRSNET